MAKKKSSKKQAAKKSGAKKQTKVELLSTVDARQALVEALPGQLTSETKLRVTDAYCDMSEQVAMAKSPGSAAYPSQQRTGMKKLLVAMGVDEVVVKALDRAIRVNEYGAKK